MAVGSLSSPVKEGFGIAHEGGKGQGGGWEIVEVGWLYALVDTCLEV